MCCPLTLTGYTASCFVFKKALATADIIKRRVTGVLLVMNGGMMRREMELIG